jgi:cyclophilin family peptidyl-prolyl cis-trans isomerase
MPCPVLGPRLVINPMKRTFTVLLALLAPLTVFADAEKSSAPAATKIRLKTNHGDIVLELNKEKAPVTVANFVDYVKKKHYDGTVFHRVINGFMIQGGGFESKDGTLVEKPAGKPIANEGKNGLKNARGTIAMARTNDPNSAKAQFFINVQDNAMLDYPNNGGYAVFGLVVEGMEVVDKIKSLPTGTGEMKMLHPTTGETIEIPAQDVPNAAVIISSATLE